MLWMWAACSSGGLVGVVPGTVPEVPPIPATTGSGDTSSPQVVDTDTDTGTPSPAALLTFGEVPRNVLMLSIDTTRRQYVDRYSTDGVERMPFLTSILDQGITLDDHVQCANWTFPSTNCTLSGTMLEDMVHVPRFSDAGSPVPDGQRTLARLLAGAGFHTMLVSSNGWLGSANGNTQGYVEYESRGGATDVVDRGLELLDEALPGPASDHWLLHMHFIEPHDPYNPPDRLVPELEKLPPVNYDLGTPWGHDAAKNDYPNLPTEEQLNLSEHMKISYAGDMRWFDEQLSEAWARFDALGLLDDTLVVIWTDHGEAFWERGRQAHAWFLGAEENDAVLSFWHRDFAPRSWAGPTHSIDLMPTVLDALELEVPKDLVGEIVGLAPEDRYRFTATSGFVGQYQAVIHEGWKMSIGWNGLIRLHDRNTDRMELDDLYVPGHPKADALWPILREHVERMEPLVPEDAVDWKALP